ncbi:enoyl-CoA hydratase/isomerase family protein [Gemmatimonas sp.]|uniref:enoyl-CoA hydratase/isomerase family protein n=1 Tax=Gemmatimonas sp. TaxID=1962908 RepID=UPI0035672285
MSDLVHVERNKSSVIVTLHRPAALNALTVQMLDDLAHVLHGLASDNSVRVVVLTGAGRAFCAGVDLQELQRRTLSGGRVGDDFDEAAASVTSVLSTMPHPTIGAVNGACFTGGLELALACDVMIAANEASIGDTHAKWGLRPTWGMTQRLGRAAGPGRARLLSFTGRTFTGRDAAAFGIAAESVPVAELRSHVLALAEEIAGNSSDAISAYKDLYAASDNSFLGQGLETERARNYEIADTQDRLERFTSRRVADP